MHSPGSERLVDQAKRTETLDDRIAKLFYASRSSIVNFVEQRLVVNKSAACIDDVFIVVLHLFYFVVLVLRRAQPTAFARSYWLIVVVTCYSHDCHVRASAIVCAYSFV